MTTSQPLIGIPCRHDRSGRPFDAVAMQPAVVLSVNQDWRPGNPRGGRYVWLYQPTQRLLYYYAHLGEVAVRPGDVVPRGGRLGTVGKTGFPARHAHHPCHIHLMVLRPAGGDMVPVNWFRWFEK